MKKIFSYNFEDVGYLPLDDLIVRSASGKEGINLNKKLFAFFMHRNHLYFWNKGVIQLVAHTQSHKM